MREMAIIKGKPLKTTISPKLRITGLEHSVKWLTYAFSSLSVSYFVALAKNFITF